MIRLTIRVASVLTLTVIAAGTANAQLTNNGSSGSGTSGFGSSLTGSSSGSSTGSSSSSSNSNSGSGSGSGASGNANAGVSEFSINTDNVQNAATGFVGSNSSQAFVGGVRQSTNQQATNRQFGAFQNTQPSSNTQSTQSGTPRSIRTTMKIAFAAPSGTFAQQTGVLADSNSVQLTQFSAKRPELSGINVELTADGVAVLTGTSPSTETSRLAANLVRLQPGVRKVTNQIAVAR